MKKWVVLALVSCLFFLAACGSTKNAGEDQPKKEDAGKDAGQAGSSSETKADAPKIAGKITVYTNRTDVVDTKMKEYGDKFKQKYPDVDVSFEALGDPDKDIKVRISSGEYADVLLIPNGISLADHPKYFAPLDDLGLNDKIFFKDAKTVDGKLYGISSGGTLETITYNKKAFAAAGITDIPKTWDEFLAACEKLKAAGILPLATNFKEQWTLRVWSAKAAAIANDPNYYNNWAKSDAPFTIDGPMGQAMTHFRTLIEKGYVEPDLFSTNWMQSHTDFANAKIGMFFLGQWMVNNAVNQGGNADDFGHFSIPLDNEGHSASILSSDWFYAINKNSKNLDTAKEFLRWWLEETDYHDYTGLYPPLKDQVPASKPLADYLATKPTIIEDNPKDDNYIKITNKAQIDLFKMLQDFAVAKDLEASFKEYNEKWAAAKKELGM